MKNLLKQIEVLKNENATLKNEIVNIRLRDEQREIAENSQNLIINGFQDETDPKEKIISALNFVFTKSNSPLSAEAIVKEIHPIGKPSTGPSKNRTFKVKCTDKASRDTLLRNAKCLRTYEQNKQIYINADLPPLTRRENSRLRTKLRQLTSTSPNADIRLIKGELTVNGTLIDQFSLENQLFRP